MTMWLMLQDDIERIEAYVGEFVSQVNLDGAVRASKPMHIDKGVASISVKGPLINGRSRVLDFFGVEYTTYGDIVDQSAKAVKDGAKEAEYYFDTPGGTIDGMYNAMSAIKEMPIKTRAIAGPTMASAGFMLGSQTDEILAENELSMIGSVGVATDVDTREGVKSIANTDSPKKRPDTSTEEGQAEAREPLDDIYQVLAEKIAIGRNVSPETVKKEYGQGAVMTARTAKQKGMIDSIGVETHKPTAPKQAAANQGDRMNAQILKEEHPEVYDAILQKGVKAERDRVSAHLVAAEGGDIEAAHEAIQNGEGYTGLVKAKHDAFARKQQMIEARKNDNAEDIDTAAEAPMPNDEDAKIQAEFAAAHPGCTMEVI